MMYLFSVLQWKEITTTAILRRAMWSVTTEIAMEVEVFSTGMKL
jgi:hypothetical protein